MPSIRVEVPGLGIVEFPEGTAPETMTAAIQQQVSATRDQGPTLAQAGRHAQARAELAAADTHEAPDPSATPKGFLSGFFKGNSAPPVTRGDVQDKGTAAFDPLFTAENAGAVARDVALLGAGRYGPKVVKGVGKVVEGAGNLGGSGGGGGSIKVGPVEIPYSMLLRRGASTGVAGALGGAIAGEPGAAVGTAVGLAAPPLLRSTGIKMQQAGAAMEGTGPGVSRPNYERGTGLIAEPAVGGRFSPGFQPLSGKPTPSPVLSKEALAVQQAAAKARAVAEAKADVATRSRATIASEKAAAAKAKADAHAPVKPSRSDLPPDTTQTGTTHTTPLEDVPPGGFSGTQTGTSGGSVLRTPTPEPPENPWAGRTSTGAEPAVVPTEPTGFAPVTVESVPESPVNPLATSTGTSMDGGPLPTETTGFAPVTVEPAPSTPVTPAPETTATGFASEPAATAGGMGTRAEATTTGTGGYSIRVPSTPEPEGALQVIEQQLVPPETPKAAETDVAPKAESDAAAIETLLTREQAKAAAEAGVDPRGRPTPEWMKQAEAEAEAEHAAQTAPKAEAPADWTATLKPHEVRMLETYRSFRTPEDRQAYYNSTKGNWKSKEILDRFIKEGEAGFERRPPP